MRAAQCKIYSCFLLYATVFGMLLFSCRTSFAQTKINLQDSLEKKLNWYKQTHPATTLFAHFDKTVYTNNENVWFTAYLLNSTQANDNYNTLSVSLVNDIDRSIIMQEKFVMHNGIASGNLFLPDSIAPGNYTFMLCTNQLVNKQPESAFTQPITVKNTNETDVKATLTIEDSSKYNNAKPQKAILTVTKNNLFPAANATVNYQIMGEDGVALSGKAKTDKAGLYTLVLPPHKNSVKVQVKYNKDSKYVHLLLPQKQTQIRVKFYPEGGSLVNNLTSNVGWEVKTAEGLPLRVRGVLLQNNRPVDTLATDSYGMGKFMLTPQPDSKYSVKLLNQPDSTYYLPTARTAGLVVMMNKSIANDTLRMQLQSSYDTDIFLNVHNYRHLFFNQIIRLKKMQQLKVYVDFTELPKGLAEITLTDSSGHPYAERLFFAHYNHQELLNLQTEKQLYHTREKVHLKLLLRGLDTSLIKGVVSVACVQDNRLELKKQNDIISYFYLKHDLGDLPLKENYMGKNSIDKMYLENVLLIKGWRNYLWLDLLKAKTQDTTGIISSAAFAGSVTNGIKPIKKPASVFVMTDSASHIITTTANGHFEITPDYLITNQDKKVNFLIANNSGHIRLISQILLSQSITYWQSNLTLKISKRVLTVKIQKF